MHLLLQHLNEEVDVVAIDSLGGEEHVTFIDRNGYRPLRQEEIVALLDETWQAGYRDAISDVQERLKILVA